MTALLEWALVGGKPTRAAEFVGVKDRPVGMCPCCLEEIVWKAGDVLIPHVAHASGSACATRSSESAQHYNAKMRIASILAARSSPLRLIAPCVCGQTVRAPWRLSQWNSAEVERLVGNRRPDVLLVKTSDSGSDFEIAAIEILHTHSVGAQKVEDLAAAGLPWIEVGAAEALSWDGNKHLRVVNLDEESRSDLSLSCDRCIRQRELASAERERSRLVAFRSECRSYETRRIEKQRVVRWLLENPPRIQIAIAASLAGGDAAVAAVLIAPGKAPSVCVIDCSVTWTEATWLALKQAVERLETIAPGKAATFFTRSKDVAKAAMDVPYPTLDDTEDAALRRSVIKAIEDRGHLVLFADRTSAATGWIEQAKEAAEVRLSEMMAQNCEAGQ